MNNIQLRRLTIIHQAIKDKKYPNNPKLRAIIAETMRLDDDEIPSEATINRDIKELRNSYQAPIVWSNEYRGYYYTDEKWNFSVKPLNSSDVLSLGLFNRIMENYRGTPIFGELDEIINYIVKLYGSKDLSILKRITVAPSPQAVIDELLWQDIWVAIAENREVEFDYTSQWRGELVHHRVRPYQILLDEGMYYLWGYDYSTKHDGIRLFNFPLISNLVLTKTTFKLPEDYEFSKQTGGGKMGVWFDKNISDYAIEFTGIARNYVKSRKWADNQEIEDHPDENYLIIRFKSAQWYKIEQWILSMGCGARPLEPAWLVDWWKEEIKKMRALAE